MELLKRNTTLLLSMALVITLISIKRNIKRSIVVRSSCFEHQLSDILDIDGVKVKDLVLRGKGIYAVVVKRSMGKVYTDTFHVGILKMSNFESRIKDMNSFIKKEKSKGFNTLILFSIGSTHEKGVMEEIRNGIVDDEYVELAGIFRLYGMKKILSMAHGCRQPYILIHDLNASNTLSERTGECGGTLCAKVQS